MAAAATTPDILAQLMARIAAGERVKPCVNCTRPPPRSFLACASVSFPTARRVRTFCRTCTSPYGGGLTGYPKLRSGERDDLAVHHRRNRAIDRLRARGPLAYAGPIDDLEIADGADSAETLLSAADNRNKLHGCLSELDERTEKVIRTAFFEGVTYETLARNMDAPLGTVKSWNRRGLAKLKGCLQS